MALPRMFYPVIISPMTILEGVRSRDFRKFAANSSAFLGTIGALALILPSPAYEPNSNFIQQNRQEASAISLSSEVKENSNDWIEHKTKDGISVFAKGERIFPVIGGIANTKVEVNPEAFVGAIETMGDRFGNRKQVENYLQNRGLHIDLTLQSGQAVAALFISGDSVKNPSIIYYPVQLIDKYIYGVKDFQNNNNRYKFLSIHESTVYEELYHQYQDITNHKMVEESLEFQRIVWFGVILGSLVIGTIGSKDWRFGILCCLIVSAANAISGNPIGAMYNPADKDADNKIEIIMKDPAFVKYRSQFFTYDKIINSN
jgi:hypothetical protein